MIKKAVVKSESKKELRDKLEAIKKKNEASCINAVKIVLKKYDCRIETNVRCVLNDTVVEPIIVAN